MTSNKRWTLLEHTGDPDDPVGIHFDLLLEDSSLSCRSWRLMQALDLKTISQEIVQLPDHKLSWLDKKEGIVSGKRGFARRLHAGFYLGELPLDAEAKIRVSLYGESLSGILEIHRHRCNWQAL